MLCSRVESSAHPNSASSPNDLKPSKIPRNPPNVPNENPENRRPSDETSPEAESSDDNSDGMIEVEYVMNPQFPDMPSSVPLTYTLAMHACLSTALSERPTFGQVHDSNPFFTVRNSQLSAFYAFLPVLVRFSVLVQLALWTFWSKIPCILSAICDSKAPPPLCRS